MPRLPRRPDGRFLIAANVFSTNISVFSIAANGALTIVPGSPVPAGDTPDGIKVSPNGKFLAVALIFNRAIQMFSIGSNGGLTLVPGSPFPTRGFGAPAGVEINCASNLLFAGEAVSPGTVVDVFNIAPNGALSLAPGSPFVVNSGDNSNIAVLSPDDRSLFVSNQFSNSITVFNVAASGNLTLVPGSPFLNAGNPLAFSLGIATNQSGTLLYTIDSNASVTGFAIAANGALSTVPGSPFLTSDSGLAGIAVYPAKGCSGLDLCIQDDSNGNILRVNSTTGDYVFTNCSGFSTGGRGTVTKKGNTLTLEHNAGDRRVLARYDGSVKKATASVQIFPQGINATISDRNTADNTCACR
jgi:6-phosphogluconolactonase (cycloisomerase 2 family)